MFMLSFSTVLLLLFFFFNDTATTEIYTLSLHDALPISPKLVFRRLAAAAVLLPAGGGAAGRPGHVHRHAADRAFRDPGCVRAVVLPVQPLHTGGVRRPLLEHQSGDPAAGQRGHL